MSDFVKALNTVVSQNDWDRMSKHAGVSAAELKEKLVPALEAAFQEGTSEAVAAKDVSEVSLAAAAKDGNCQSQSFEVSLFKIVGISGTLTLCGTNSSNWTAELKFCLIVAGSSVWCTSYQFDPHHLRVCFSPSVGLAKADICFELQIGNGKVCLNIKGQACAWAFGWKCGSFDKTLFCIPLP